MCTTLLHVAPAVVILEGTLYIFFVVGVPGVLAHGFLGEHGRVFLLLPDPLLLASLTSPIDIKIAANLVAIVGPSQVKVLVRERIVCRAEHLLVGRLQLVLCYLVQDFCGLPG